MVAAVASVSRPQRERLGDAVDAAAATEAWMTTAAAAEPKSPNFDESIAAAAAAGVAASVVA